MPTATATHRLVDMVVEEVSLVDRAANQRRFLIVKRDPMTDTSNDPATHDDIADGGDTSFGADGTSVDATATDDASAVPEPLVETLDALTTAVEALDAGATIDRAALAATLTAAAAALAPTAPAAAPEQTPASAPAAQATQAPSGAVDARGALLALAASLGVDLGAAPAATPPPTTTAAPAAAAPPAAPTADAAAIRTALETLTSAVREQGQRLGRVEKQFGLPNSTPVDGQPAAAKPRGVSWPVDLNRPLDRDSVEKTVSFHDL